MPQYRSLLPWLLAYLAVVSAVCGGLVYARLRALDTYAGAQARSQWQQWKTEARRQSEGHGPVSRRPVRSDEPPALVLMRDHFSVILGGCLLVSSFLFGFVAFLLRGIAAGCTTSFKPAGRQQA